MNFYKSLTVLILIICSTGLKSYASNDHSDQLEPMREYLIPQSVQIFRLSRQFYLKTSVLITSLELSKIAEFPSIDEGINSLKTQWSEAKESRDQLKEVSLELTQQIIEQRRDRCHMTLSKDGSLSRFCEHSELALRLFQRITHSIDLIEVRLNDDEIEYIIDDIHLIAFDSRNLDSGEHKDRYNANYTRILNSDWLNENYALNLGENLSRLADEDLANSAYRNVIRFGRNL
jgi:hypothetical protein